MLSITRRLSAKLALALFFGLAGGCGAAAPLAPNAVRLNAEGVDALSRGDLEAASARFALALEYHPRFVEALVNAGLVELERGNLERARVLFERARRTNADVAQAHHALGVLAERERRPDVAAERYRDALRVDPGFAPSRANLGRLLYAAKRFDEARESYARLVALAPDDPGANAGLVESLLRVGREREADRALALALTRFGDLPALVVLDGRRLLREGRVDDAKTRLATIAEGSDDVARAARSFAAVAWLAGGDVDGAIARAELALALDRNDALATWVAALALEARGDARAPLWRERAVRLAPDGFAPSAPR